MQAVQKIFIGFVAFCATLGAAVGVLLYIAATPYIWIIGKFVAGLFITVLICASVYAAVWTFCQISIQWSKRRQARNEEGLISAPADRHSIYLQPANMQYTIHKVSADVAAASVPRMLPAPKDEVLEADDATILELYNDGQVTLETIAEQLHISYYRAQRVIAECKKKGLVNRR